jgi:transposase
MGYIEGKDRKQLILMNTIDDLVSRDNPVRFIDALIDGIGISRAWDSSSEVMLGRSQYKKTTLLKLYLYGYLNRISSSRRLETETQRNIELIWLLSGLSPDHWTISEFRKENGDLIKEVTVSFRRYLIEKGYIGLKQAAIDGSKVKANSKRSMLTMHKIEKRMQSLEVKLQKYLKALQTNDENSDDIDIDDNDGHPREITDKDKREELEKINKEITKLKEAKEKLITENRNYISLTDQEAELMKTQDGKMASYNIQTVVDDKHHMITYSEVTSESTDNNMTERILKTMNKELGRKPEIAILDNGYNNMDMIERVEKALGIDCYVAQSSKREAEIRFKYNKEKDEYRCSEDKVLRLFQKNKLKRKSLTDVYMGIDCVSCIKKPQCTSSDKGRIVHRYHNQQYRDEYNKKMQRKESQERLKKRRSIIEHSYGTIKLYMGKIPLLLRGIKKVTTEINIYTTVYNLRRLINIKSTGELIEDMKEYKWEFA